jgi:rhodanese-related sulfurtransferase
LVNAIPNPAPAAPDARQIEAIFARAAERAAAMKLPYAGAVTPEEAWRLHSAGAAAIVDVRTRPEWEFVGHIAGVPLLEWRRYGEQRPNPAFAEELESLLAKDEAVLFICRSGVRSHHAAELAARAGHARAYNILEGFEGDLDPGQRRGALGGWRRAGLPWIQT